MPAIFEVILSDSNKTMHHNYVVANNYIEAVNKVRAQLLEVFVVKSLSTNDMVDAGFLPENMREVDSDE